MRLGDTAVVCGIRPEILRAADIPHPSRTAGTDDYHQSERAIQDLGLLVPNLELSTGCSPAHLPGNAPTTLAQSLTHRLLSLLHASHLISLDQLRIQYQPPLTDDDIPDEPQQPVTKAYWTLYIDILFISLDGNPFDAAWAAILAALNNTTLPKAWWDADREAVLCSEKTSEATALTLRAFPVASTFAVFSTASPHRPRAEEQSWVLSDPDGFEDDLCDEAITVVVADEKTIVKLEKRGGHVIRRDETKDMVEKAVAKWRDWEALLKQNKR